MRQSVPYQHKGGTFLFRRGVLCAKATLNVEHTEEGETEKRADEREAAGDTLPVILQRDLMDRDITEARFYVEFSVTSSACNIQAEWDDKLVSKESGNYYHSKVVRILKSINENINRSIEDI